MIRRLFVVCAMLFLCVGHAHASDLTLTRAYQLALQQSEQLKISDAEIRAAEARYRQVAGGFWPEINAEGTADLNEASVDEYRIGVGGRWTIFQGFRTVRDAEAARMDGESVRFNQQRYRELLYRDVADVFYLLLGLGRDLQVVDEEIKAFDSRIAELEERVKVGRSRKPDLISSRAERSTLNMERAQLEGLHRSSQEMLSFLTGLPRDQINPVEAGAIPVTSALQMESSDDRADIKAAILDADAAGLAAKAAQSGRMISVSADGNVYVWQDPDDQDGWDLMIRAGIPLFDGGIRRGEVAEAVATKEVREFRLAELRRIADRDLRMATDRLDSLLEQWRAMSEAIALAKENLEIQSVDYSMGRASNLDVISAMVQEFNLQRRAVSLEMQIRAALVHVQVAAGGVVP